MTVNSFVLTANIVQELETSLSPERIATYLAASKGDREKALRLHTWNTAVSAAFYGPLQGLEVSLRNAMHRELSATYGPSWFDNPACGFDQGSVNRIESAKADLIRDGYVCDPPHVVATLSFGFWVMLLGKGGRIPGPRVGKQNYEMTLWRPCLYRAFPHKRLARTDVHRPLDYLRTFRNRIAHHEPVFSRHLAADYQQILTLTEWINPVMRDWIIHHSRVASILNLPKDSGKILF